MMHRKDERPFTFAVVGSSVVVQKFASFFAASPSGELRIQDTRLDLQQEVEP